jgi:hypothetical protein
MKMKTSKTFGLNFLALSSSEVQKRERTRKSATEQLFTYPTLACGELLRLLIMLTYVADLQVIGQCAA